MHRNRKKRKFEQKSEEYEFHYNILFPFLYQTCDFLFPKDLTNIICEYSLVTWLSPLQEDAVDRAVYKRENLFICGGGGVGKSFLLKLISKNMQELGLNVYMTGITGLSSTFLPNAITTNSFMGVGLAQDSIPELVKKAKSRGGIARWRSCQVLFIDEVSMMKPFLFELVNIIAQTIRSNNKPFGGIQLIVSGDFCQLPPVYKPQEIKYLGLTYAFQHPLWKRYLGPKNTIYLRDTFRQREPKVYESLNRLRVAEHTQEDDLFWKAQIRCIPSNLKIELTRLCGTNSEAEYINNQNLETKCPKHSHERHTYISQSIRTQEALKNPYKLQLAEAFLKNMSQKSLIRPELVLALGAKVMLITNLEPCRKLINGTCGKIVGFQNNFPEVEFEMENNETIRKVIQVYYWPYEYGREILASYGQIPLLLAWAITIHKSQGMSLEHMSVDVSRAFVCGQAYVALSRMKNLKNVILTGYNSKAFRIDPLVKEFERSLK